MKTTYEYPDKDDKATQVGVDASEPYPGYWKKSEEYVLRFVDDMLRFRTFDTLLDIGCGKGRLTSRYAPYFNRTVALEPDESRLGTAETTFENQGLCDIACLQQKFLDARFTDSSFDAVICSHVIQHIPSYEVADFIDKTWKILKKNGVLVLLTTHSRKRHNVYLDSYVEEGQLMEPVISEARFNDLCEHPSGSLPSCLFSLGNIREQLHGFKIPRMRVFHALYRMNLLDSLVFRDRVINLPLIRRYCGQDMFLMGVKK